MTWNHRVIKHKDRLGDEYYVIHECHYERRGAKIPKSWTENYIAPMGCTLEQLRETLQQMLRACDRPVLVEHDNKLKKETKRK